MEEIKTLPKLDEKEFINSPVIKNYEFEQNTNLHVIRLEKKREENKKKIISDINGTPYLKEMDITREIESFIELTELIEDTIILQKNMTISIIGEMASLCSQRYVKKKEFNKLKIYKENLEKELMKKDKGDDNKITDFIEKAKRKLNEKLDELDIKKLRGYVLNFQRLANLEEFSDDERQIFLDKLKKLEEEFQVRIVKKDEP